MLNSIQAGLNSLSAFQAKSSSASTSGNSFGSILANAASISSAAGSGVTISDAGKATASGRFDFDFSWTNINHTKDELVAHYAEGADRVSEMQGLPPGQYDFSNMSPKQFAVVQSHLSFSGKIDSLALVGFPDNRPEAWDSKYTPSYSDQPVNWLAQAKNELGYNSSTGNVHATYLSQRAVDIFTQLLTSPTVSRPTEVPDWVKALETDK